jgi:hypothetical protein
MVNAVNAKDIKNVENAV